MIKSVLDVPVHALLSAETNTVYEIPPYQREYSWSKEQWDNLFDDLLSEDPNSGHFLGTIICVNTTKNTSIETTLELVDGQQRMTTISLLLLALYTELAWRSAELDEDQTMALFTLRRMLTLRDPIRPRLRLQKQNYNQDDYLTILTEAGFDFEVPNARNVGNRRIKRALVHFQKRIQAHYEGAHGGEVGIVFDLLQRAKSAILVKLEVESHSDAFVLFESLNNRGLPLTPIDLIKNSLLSTADKDDDLDVTKAYKSWAKWLHDLGDDYTNQERFFRQFYNAFKVDMEIAVTGVPVATRSKLIRIYEEMIKDDVQTFIKRMSRATTAYARILGRNRDEQRGASLDQALLDLSRAQGTPAYMLLLFLLVNQERLGISDGKIAEVTRLLIKFFIRRNLTNTPPTYALDRLFMDLIEKLVKAENPDVLAMLRADLREASADDEVFLKHLMGPIYDENSQAARFILVALAHESMTNKESWTDLWIRDEVGESRQQFRWTIEHVVPQGENLPADWVSMLGGKANATEVQKSLVHCLGNLSITGYNSTLGNKSFADKRDRKDSREQYIGYKNGLGLNQELAQVDAWTAADIERRTSELADRALSIFRLTT